MLIDVAATLDDTQKIRFDAYLRNTRETRTEEDVQWILGLMHDINAIEKAQMFARGLAGAALREFETLAGALPDSRDKRFIRDLITWTFHRDH